MFTTPSSSQHWATQCIAVISIIVNYAYVAGYGLIFYAIMHMKKHGEQRSGSGLTMAVVYLFVGIMLVGGLPVLEAFRKGVWGSVSSVDFFYGGKGNDNSAGAALINNVLIFMAVLGVGLFIRGLFYFLQAGQEQGQKGMVGKGIMAVMVAVLCLNAHGSYNILVGTMMSIFPDSLNIPYINSKTNP